MPVTTEDQYYVSQVQDPNQSCKQDRDRSLVMTISQGCSGPEYWSVVYVNVHQVGVDLWQGVSMNTSIWTSRCVRTSNVCRIRLIDNALWKGRIDH